MSGLLKVSSNPHIRSKVTTSSIMTAVVIALLPAAGFGIYNFGPRALAVMAVTIASTVLTELLFGWLWKKKITISDMSAVVTGLLLALNLPVSIPLWMAALGGVCHPCGKNAVRWSGSELYEPGTGSQMLSADLFPVPDDEFCL